MRYSIRIVKANFVEMNFAIVALGIFRAALVPSLLRMASSRNASMHPPLPLIRPALESSTTGFFGLLSP